MKKLVMLISLLVLSHLAAAAPKMYFVHSDHLGTPQKLTNDSQQVIWKVKSQTPFGEVEIMEDPDGDGNLVTFNLRFPGQYFDEETETYYNWFRNYDSGLGRYLQSDPLGMIDGPNTYAYVGNNPINFVDRLGLFLSPSEANQVIAYGLGEPVRQSFRQIRNNSTADASVLFPLESQSQQRDAYRHCLASCRVTSQHGSTWATILGNAHEIRGNIFNSQTSGSEAMDHHNNQCGIDAGELDDESSCEDRCISLLNSGELETSIGGTGQPYELY